MARDERQGESFLAVETAFSAQDASFLDRLRACRASAQLGTFAPRWLGDPRPWSRAQLLAYLALPFDAPGHEALVKRLFKGAEERGDAELMGAFLAAFDGLVRRKLAARWSWNAATASADSDLVAITSRNVLPRDVRREGGRWVRAEPARRVRAGQLLYSFRTRHYLRRRAWRWFRRLGQATPDAYVPAVAAALPRWRDADLGSGLAILDNRGLLQACFGESDVVDLSGHHAELRDGRALGDLAAAPSFPELWRADAARPELLKLVAGAPARLVRIFALQVLRAHHRDALAGAGLEALLPLLRSEHAEARELAASVLAEARGLQTLPLTAWLELLEATDPDVLRVVTTSFRKHVAGSRVSTELAVSLAVRPASPVARLGLDALTSRGLGPGDRPLLARLAAARSAAVGRELADLALKHLGGADWDRDAVTAFFDAGLAETRAGALAWLADDASPGATEPVLWSRLMETPHDDVRLELVRMLERRSEIARAAGDAMAPAWIAVLLGIHRGGRTKALAAAQVERAVAAEPARSAALLPVLAVAARSPRAPERRAAIAALVRLAAASPELARDVSAQVPELSLVAPRGCA